MNGWNRVTPPKRVCSETARNASSGVVTRRDTTRVPCPSAPIHDSLGLTTAGSPTSFKARETSSAAPTETLGGTAIPSRFAIASVCSLLTAMAIALSFARAMRTRRSSRARCRRSRAIVPSCAGIRMRAPVRSRTCSKSLRYASVPWAPDETKPCVHQREENAGAWREVSSSATVRFLRPRERTVTSDCLALASRINASTAVVSSIS